MSDLVVVDGLGHRYGSRVALENVSFVVRAGEFFGLLGPNGGGKTTLFRILTTLLPSSAGKATICGHDALRHRDEVRRRIGVVFQSPSLDLYLSARENLRHAGRLYGLSGRTLETRLESLLDRFGLADRADDLVRALSGGMRRRVEIAKGMLHEPSLLILDEPSTGLDPSVRRELWSVLEGLRDRTGVTILLTTHFLEEAEHCDRLAILDRGRLVACGSPAELKARVGGDCIRVDCERPEELARAVSSRLGIEATVVDGQLRVETRDGPALVGRLMSEFGGEVRAITLGKPTLEDVFIHETGHRFEHADVANAVGEKP